MERQAFRNAVVIGQQSYNKDYREGCKLQVRVNRQPGH